jgi:F0F1-type ATP synthase membrane subunit c/vacuolar-type H+-ATPase subunit K
MTVQTQNVDQLSRTMAIIWFVLLMSQFALVGVAFSLIPQEAVPNAQYGFLSQNPPIIIGALTLAVSNLVISFFMRQRAQEQAVAEQNVKYVQTGLVLACAFCESISLIGMVLAIAFAYPFFYLWSALGIFGIFLHFPRRKHLLDATSAPVLK